MKKILLSIFLFVFTIHFYGQIQPYYNGLDLTKTENDLFLELSNRIIVTNPGIPYTSGSTDTWDVLKQVDEDPKNTSNVLLIYGYNDNDGISNTDRTRDKNLQDTGGGDPGKWNREHVFAKSLAIPNLGTEEPGPGTDVHNLRPSDSERNSDRSNRKFTEGSGNSGIVSTNGGWYPGDEWRGDVARIVMYMYLRYHGSGSQISETTCLPINVGIGMPLTIDSNMIDLFLNWNIIDPVSDVENQRNDYIETVQGNRNPFIDNPYLATLIWGGVNAEDKWNLNNTSDNEAPSTPTNLTASNITHESLDISWNEGTDNIGVIDYLIYLNGQYLKTSSFTSTSILGLNENTNYSITVKARDAASNLSDAGLVSFTTLEGPTYLINEDFNNCSNVQFFTYSESSTEDWECSASFGENNSGSYGMNGYNALPTESKDWLITKDPVNFDVGTAEKLSFYTDATYGTDPLELVYSSNYNGSGIPSNYTWSSVPNVSPLIHDDSSTEKIYITTDADISSISGTVYFAFKYYSEDSPTRWTVDSFEITAEVSDDNDNDNVLNDVDLCPNTPSGETVDENGCSESQLDDDIDGIANGIDICENTPAGEQVNATGCSESQLDDDEDGVWNNVDLCPNTPSGEEVDANGCSYSQLDDDIDGIVNGIDICENTPAGEQVNATGCAESQLDDDGDTIMNDIDLCPNTPTSEDVDVNGCSSSQLDDDEDNVMNDIDLCPNSTAGSTVNASGCFTLPKNNFTIETISETCADKNNGQILINAQESHSYNVTLNGENASFQNTNLNPGNYTICINVAGEDYEQCYDVVIDEGTTISGKATINSGKVSINIEQGTAPFNVFVNKIEVLRTVSNQFTINATNGDLIEIKSDVSCEGVFSKSMDSFSEIVAYPNPTKGSFEIALPVAKNKVKIELYNIQSQLISRREYHIIYGKVQLNLNNNTSGLYFAKVYLETPVLLKIIKE